MQDTYSIRELMARYSCAASTIYRRMIKDGYPKPSRFGKGKNKWAAAAVHAWELIHMPHLHPTQDEAFLVEDTQVWAKLRGDYERKLQKDVTGKPKPVPKKRWEDVQREGRDVIAQIKKRHEPKPVAPRG